MIPTLKKPNVTLFILLLAPFVRPVGIDYFPSVGKLMTLWKLLALVYLAVGLIPLLMSPAPKRKPFAIWGLAIFWLIYLLGCIRVGKEVVSIATAGIASILLLLLTEYSTRNENGMVLLKAMHHLFVFYIVAHLCSVFLVKAGVLWMGFVGESPVYLFGMDNYSAFFIYPMLAVILYYQALRYGTFRPLGWLLLFGVVAVYVLTKSLTAAGAGLIMIPLLLIRYYWKKLPQLRGARWLILCMSILLILICGFQAQNLLASLLNSMSKGVTLNSRTYIWEFALKLIAQKPVLGHGTFTDQQLYKEYILYGTSHAHNLLLELLLRTGIVGTAGYLVFLFGFSPLGKKPAVSQAHGALLVGLVGQLVLMFMDFYPTILVFYLFMGVLYYSPRLSAYKKSAHREDAP